ncbi:MAG: prohibitin family protein [Candidatus Schekmanbacteria bacterium]|nr:prohibitin family protein [Candidatus Schekmanbacteria bacterium]
MSTTPNPPASQTPFREYLARATIALGNSAGAHLRRLFGWRGLALLVVLGLGIRLVSAPPVGTVGPGEVGLRANRLTGELVEFPQGAVVVLPYVHELRRFPLRDQIYRPRDSSSATASAPFQSLEGLSVGCDLTVRYALDPAQIKTVARTLPKNIDGELIEPLVSGVIYKIFSQHTVRQIFSSDRKQIQQAIEDELRPLLSQNGVLLRAVFMGNVDLPREYRAGLEKLLAEELNAERMKFTLDLKGQEVKQRELEAEADKVRREKAAEAAGNEQIIAAKAQEEAMRHVLPFKEKQIKQRELEAEAEKGATVKRAEAQAQARRIEASGEADSRRQLAEAEAYRVEVIGKAQTEQLARDSELLARNPLLIQKTLADKLSDKISVIIAPPAESGGFIAQGILGGPARTAAASTAAHGYAPRSEALSADETAEDGADDAQVH